MWCGDPAFEARMRELLCDPIEHTQRFDPEWMPVRRLVAVLGNREAQKASVVAQFCNRHMLASETVVIRYGFTTDSIEQIKAVLKEKRNTISVLILDHVDVLALEPDDITTQRYALDIEALALEHLIFVVGCFDRVLKHATDVYVRHFWRPWATATAYLAPPHSTWIAAWLQTQMEAYARSHHDEIKLEISEGEYTVLAQHCVGASYGHLRDWIQKIFYFAYQNPTVIITKDLLCGVPFMYGGNRGLHIVSQDVRRDESQFSEAIGQGPTVVEPPPPPGEEEEEQVPLMEDLDKKEKKKKRRKRVKEEEEVDIEAPLLKDGGSPVF